MLVSGDLQKKIDEDDLRGVTSNPLFLKKRSLVRPTMTNR